MSAAPRFDRAVVGGRRSTAGGRAWALRARLGPGYELRIKVRQHQAYRLRQLGATYREIGEQLGVSAMQAWRDVWAALLAEVGQEGQPEWVNRKYKRIAEGRALLAGGAAKPRPRVGTRLVARRVASSGGNDARARVREAEPAPPPKPTLTGWFEALVEGRDRR